MNFKDFSYLTFQLLALSFLITEAFCQDHTGLTEHLNSSPIFREAIALRSIDPDSAALLFEQSYRNSLSQGDTANAIQSLIELADLYSYYANYGKSYDGFWEALLLADKANDEVRKVAVYRGIAMLYSLYKRKDVALTYYKRALDLNRSLVQKGIVNEENLNHDYYGMVILYREDGNIEMAKEYLDSCYSVLNKEKRDKFDFRYPDAETAFLLLAENKPEEALKKLNEVTPLFKSQSSSSFMVIINSFYGDIYKELGDFSKSEASYLKSLELADKYKSHVDYKIGVHQKLAELYYAHNKPTKAYKELKASKDINDQLFGSRSINNKHLLEIQDKYRIEKEYQENLLLEKRLSELEQEERIWFLKSIIFIGSIASILLFGFLYFRYIRMLYKAGKHKIELEYRKANEILEIKNKELATSTLQLIEKEELLSNIKDQLNIQKDNPNLQEIEKLAKSIRISNSRSWEEFEARFVAVNDSFYGRLLEKFPDLSQSEQRMCALIKLNFSSKEMSSLLGISVESVHSSRYKLRKKLELDRSVNLGDFIAKL